jgi:hypothetical protein
MGISRFRAEPIRSLAFGSIVAGYTALGTAYEHPISKIFVVNDTDATLMFSFQGTTEDHFILPAGGFLLLDITLEAGNPDYLPKGASLYVKRSGIPTSGAAYFTAFYGLNR